jgi:hypothetical protein
MNQEEKYKNYLRKLIQAYLKFSAKYNDMSGRQKYKSGFRGTRQVTVPIPSDHEFCDWLSEQNSTLALFGLRFYEGGIMLVNDPIGLRALEIWLMPISTALHIWEFVI